MEVMKSHAAANVTALLIGDDYERGAESSQATEAHESIMGDNGARTQGQKATFAKKDSFPNRMWPCPSPRPACGAQPPNQVLSPKFRVTRPRYPFHPTLHEEHPCGQSISMRRWLATAPAVCPSRAGAVAPHGALARGLASRTSPATEPTSSSAPAAKGGGSAPVPAAGLAPGGGERMGERLS